MVLIPMLGMIKSYSPRLMPRLRAATTMPTLLPHLDLLLALPPWSSSETASKREAPRAKYLSLTDTNLPTTSEDAELGHHLNLFDAHV